MQAIPAPATTHPSSADRAGDTSKNCQILSKDLQDFAVI
jgi:hypothetical protein